MTVNDRESRTSLDRRQTRDRARRPRSIALALVNNMPDSAFVETEEQFRQVTACAPNGARIDLYTITEIPRSESVTSVIQARYRGLDDLRAHPPDALIVTGTEPKRDRLDHDPTGRSSPA